VEKGPLLATDKDFAAAVEAGKTTPIYASVSQKSKASGPELENRAFFTCDEEEAEPPHPCASSRT
jgi:hypothetical protein